MQKGVRIETGNQTGVTLVELLVVMAIIGIVVVVGVNMMGGVISKHRLRTAAEEIMMRIRAAQMLAVVKNKSVTVVFVNSPGTAITNADSFYACLDTDTDGSCADEAASNYLNLDSGKTGTMAQATITMNPMVEMYGVDFGNATQKSLTFMPPAGLPPTGAPPAGAANSAMKDAAGFVNGVVCLLVQAGDDGDDYEDSYEFRRVWVNPIAGKATMWTAVKPLAAANTPPVCDSQINDGAAGAQWKKVF